MLVVAMIGVISAIAVPMMGNALGNFRLNGDARGLTNAVSLSKLRAASVFSKARLYVDLSVNAFHIETWDKTNSVWVIEGGSTYLESTNESYNFGIVGTPPPNTQAAIGQTQCLDVTGAAIGNTACVVFNSRGIPVLDAVGSTGGPTANQALYLTDGIAVYAVTVTATGVVRLWRTNSAAAPTWVQQ